MKPADITAHKRDVCGKRKIRRKVRKLTNTPMKNHWLQEPLNTIRMKNHPHTNGRVLNVSFT